MKIYHNPKCGTSRNVLAMIREAGHEPEVIEYLKTPPTREEVMAMVNRAGVKLHDWIRINGPRHMKNWDCQKKVQKINCLTLMKPIRFCSIVRLL